MMAGISAFSSSVPLYAKTHDFYTFKSFDEYQAWQSTFSPVVQG